MLAYYGNDFTSAFFASGDFTNYLPWKYKIVALPCWSKNAYASNATTGYAVVTTCKDLNGTVLFLVWGLWGRDTARASAHKFLTPSFLTPIFENPNAMSMLIYLRLTS